MPDQEINTKESELLQRDILRVDNFVTPQEIAMQLDQLVGSGEITEDQKYQIRFALEISSEIHTGAYRRDKFRPYLLGHVPPAVKLAIENRQELVDFIAAEEIPLERVNRDQEHTEVSRQQVLTNLLLTVMGHDWYEELGKSEEKLGVQNSRLPGLRENIAKALGIEIDSNIGLLTKPSMKLFDHKKDRNAAYFDQLVNSGNRTVLVTKLIDRIVNHNDDFGVGVNEEDFERYKSYITETEENLLPWFVNYGPQQLVGRFASLLGELKTDVSENSDFLFELEQNLSPLLQQERTDGTTRWEHAQRMIDRMIGLGLRPTVGMVGAIYFHDLIESIFTGGDDKVELVGIITNLAKSFSSKVAYSLGIALATNQLEGDFRSLRDISNYRHLYDEKKVEESEQRINNIVDIYQGHIFMNEESLKRASLLRVEPAPPATDKLLGILDTDIEALLILALEKIDNFNNPPIQNGEPNAAYKWKSAQELLYLQPLLELGGFTYLAQIARGIALEFLYSDTKGMEKHKERYEAYQEYYMRNGALMVQEMRRTQVVDSTTVIVSSMKEFGSYLEKLSREKNQNETIGDIMRFKVIFQESNRITNVYQVADFLREFMSRFSNDHPGVTIQISHPRQSDKGRSIYIRSMEKVPVDILRIVPEASGKVRRKVVKPGRFESIQAYFKVEGLEKFPEGLYFEIQFENVEQYANSLLGVDSHILYKLIEGKVLDRVTKEDAAHLEEIFDRVTQYRISPKGRTYLSKKGYEGLFKLPEFEILGDLVGEEVLFEPSFEDKQKLRMLLPYVM